MAKVIAEGIKQLWYADPSTIKADLTSVTLKTLLEGAKEIENVHQDTWSIEETEPTRTGFKNQLSGGVYRENIELGDLTMNFTIGQYDFTTKADLMGGEGDETSWKRSKSTPKINKAMIALTNDDVYVVFPKSSILAREADTDGAIGVAVVATALEHDVKEVHQEYMFRKED